ncbi:MAG: phage holin family protein [Nocardioidaceae bacterium]
MKKFIVWLVVNAGALAVATWLLHGIRVSGSTRTDRFWTLLLVAIIFGVVNAIVRPVLTFLSFPFIILTLGLAILVINALMLMLTSALADQVGLGFHVAGFWTAVAGGIIVMIASWALRWALPDDR